MKGRTKLYLKKKNKKANYIEEREVYKKWAKQSFDNLVEKYSDENYNKGLNFLGVATK